MSQDLIRFLRDFGLLERPEVKPQQQRETRDVSWYKRGDECPH